MTELRGPALLREEWRKAQEALHGRVTSLPGLHLMIWPTADAVRLSLVLYYSTESQRRTCRVLRMAQWNPPEVTEEKLVEWGMKAMAHWLEHGGQDGPTTQGAWPA
jgi:hypothetical protein